MGSVWEDRPYNFIKNINLNLVYCLCHKNFLYYNVEIKRVTHMIKELKQVGKHNVDSAFWLDLDTICIEFEQEFPSSEKDKNYSFIIWGEYILNAPEFVFGVNRYDKSTGYFTQYVIDSPENDLDEEEKLTEEEKQIVIEYLKEFVKD